MFAVRGFTRRGWLTAESISEPLSDMKKPALTQRIIAFIHRSGTPTLGFSPPRVR